MSGSFQLVDEGGVLATCVRLLRGDGARLHLTANFSRSEAHRVEQPEGEIIFATDPTGVAGSEQLLLPCSVVVRLAGASAPRRA